MCECECVVSNHDRVSYSTQPYLTFSRPSYFSYRCWPKGTMYDEYFYHKLVLILHIANSSFATHISEALNKHSKSMTNHSDPTDTGSLITTILSTEGPSTDTHLYFERVDVNQMHFLCAVIRVLLLLGGTSTER